MKNAILTIDTSDNTKTVVGIILDHKKDLLYERKEKASQNLLPLIEKILNRNNIKLKDLKAIEINSGPGSYTGLRVGAAVANTLAYILKIPVNGQKAVIPKYT